MTQSNTRLPRASNFFEPPADKSYMNAGGELNLSIIRLIRRECAHAEPNKIEPCVEAVTQKMEEDWLVCEALLSKKQCRQKMNGLWKPAVKNLAMKFGEKTTEQKREQEITKPHSPIIWEEPLALVDNEITHSKFKFTHIEEWRKVEVKVTGRSLEWSYFLTKNADESFTVRWRKEGKEEQSLTFNLVDGFFPSNLMLAVQEDRNIQLILR